MKVEVAGKATPKLKVPGSVIAITLRAVAGVSEAEWFLGARLKPVLNWANVCSPNILRTVR